MAKAIRFHQTGGPEVLRLEDVAVGEPGQGEARVRQTAIGVNFVDIYHRTGLYPLPLPSGVGVDAAGVVEAAGAGVSHVRAGDRVAYLGPPGSYSEARLLPADRLVKLPADIDDRTAAGMMLKGLTVHALVRRTGRYGIVFIPFYFAEAAANMLTIDALDPQAKIPEYKICAVKIEPATQEELDQALVSAQA